MAGCLLSQFVAEIIDQFQQADYLEVVQTTQFHLVESLVLVETTQFRQ